MSSADAPNTAIDPPTDGRDRSRVVPVVKLSIGIACVAAAAVLALALGPRATAASSTPAANARPADDANVAHAQGTCGSLGPGSGLIGNKGWVVSMLPGAHEFRTRKGGSVYVTVAKKTALDFDAGRPYYIVVENASPETVLEWKTPKHDWAAIPTNFLYPPQNVKY